MKLIWTREALEKLAEIEDFISRDSQENAEKFVDYLIEQADLISGNPKIGRMVPDISNPALREIIVKNYRIVYRLKEEYIEVLTVFQGQRLLRVDELNFD